MSNERLTTMLQPLVEDLGFEFVGMEYNPAPRNAVLRVYIDAEGGVTLDDCEQVSREVAALLDVEDPIRGQYNLEISSPGLDRPLFTRDHFVRFTGAEAALSLYAPEQGRRKVRGRILGLDDGCVRIQMEDAEIALKFENIAKARLVPDYDRLMAERKSARPE